MMAIYAFQSHNRQPRRSQPSNPCKMAHDAMPFWCPPIRVFHEAISAKNRVLTFYLDLKP